MRQTFVKNEFAVQVRSAVLLWLCRAAAGACSQNVLVDSQCAGR